MMDRAQLLRDAQRWRVVAACLGGVAFVAVFGSGTLFPWQASLLAVGLLIGMIAIIYTKLQFRYSLRLRSANELDVTAVLRALRPKFSEVRVSSRRNGSSIEVKVSAGSPEIRIERVGRTDATVSVVSAPPAMGELSSARLRRRALEWADVVDVLEEALGPR